jgi:heme/copper-type cytochrome/quinol oxidase subunit 4
MLTQKELEFLHHWEEVRQREGTFARKLASGLPMAILFALPVLLSVVAVKLFLPEYDMRISSARAGIFAVVVIAVLLIAVFFAYFRMHLRWEENEQVYKSLKLKQNRADGV